MDRQQKEEEQDMNIWENNSKKEEKSSKLKVCAMQNDPRLTVIS